jgi:hypothetical protein
MGWQLAEEVQRHAPASLTYRELYVLTVYAHAANDKTRELRGSIDRPDITDRLRIRSRSERYAVRAALIKKGALERLQHARKGETYPVFRIPLMGQSPGFPDSDGSGKAREQIQESPGFPDSNSAHRRVRESQHQSPGSARGESGNYSKTVRETRTQSRHTVSPEDIPSRASPYEGATAADSIDVVRQEMYHTTGRRITREQAARIQDNIIGGRPVKRPARYLRRAIQNEPDPVRRFLPHSQPSPPPPPNDNPADPVHVAAITGPLRQRLRCRPRKPAPATTPAEQDGHRQYAVSHPGREAS